MPITLKLLSFLNSIDGFFRLLRQSIYSGDKVQPLDSKDLKEPTQLYNQDDLEGIATVNHRFKNGGDRTHTIKAHYITSGSPHQNAKGQIDNAILILPPFGGNAAATYRMWGGEKARIVGEDKLLNTKRFFVIYLDIVGVGANTSKPTNSLFDNYDIEDLSEITYKILKNCFNVSSLRLALGSSLGSQVILTMGYMYPFFLETIVPVGSTIKIKDDCELAYGEAYQKLTWMKKTLKGVQEHGNPTQTINNIQAMKNAWSMLLFGKKDYNTLTKQEQEMGPNRLVKLIEYDDLVARLNTVLNYDIKPFIHRIKANTYFGHIENDDMFSSKNIIDALELINSDMTIAFAYTGTDLLGHKAAFINGPLISQQLQYKLTEKLSSIFI